MDLILLLILVSLASRLDTASSLSCTAITATSVYQYIQSHSSFGTSDYSSNYEKCWIITTNSTDKIVGIKQIDFHLQKSDGSPACPYDRLTVYDSNDTSGTTINFCGDNMFDTLYSSGTSMYLHFKTDDKKEYEGFNIRVSEEATSLYDPEKWNSDRYEYKKDGGFNGGSMGAIISVAVGVSVSLIAAGVFGRKRCQQKKCKSAALSPDKNNEKTNQQQTQY